VVPILAVEPFEKLQQGTTLRPELAQDERDGIGA
jgi:hypothetical protein